MTEPKAEREELEFDITNVAGIEHATLLLHPGVNVLRGRNGAGKTSAKDAIVRAQGGNVDLERRDGSDHGEVTGPGVRLRVGKVVRRTGEAEVSLADTSPLSTLIDPGLKDSEAAAKARVRALIELLNVDVDKAALETLCQGDEGLLSWLLGDASIGTDDLSVVAERLKKHLHTQARDHESKAEAQAGRSGAANDTCRTLLEELDGEDGLVSQSPEDASAALAEGSKQYARAEAQCEARETLEKQQAEIRETLGERPDVEKVDAESLSIAGDKADIDAEVWRISDALAEAKERQSAKLADVTAQINRSVDVKEAADRWDTQQETLNVTPEGPAREELVALNAELVVAPQRALNRATGSEAYRTAQATHATADAAREDETGKALHLRVIADALPARLGEILARAGAKDLTVIGGRLHAIVEGQTLDWENRLSDGQRVRLALDLAARFYGGVMPLAGECWGSLDPENRAEFAALAEERGLYVITEEPTLGELRVEHAGAEEA